MTGDQAKPPWVMVMDQVGDLQRSAEALAVLTAADRVGLLRHLATPSTVAGLAAELEVSGTRLDAVLQVLRAHGIVAQMGEGWALTAAWAAVVAGDTPMRVDSQIGVGKVRADQFAAALTGGQDYWVLSDADRLSVAVGVSPDPASPVAMTVCRNDVEAMDGLAFALQRGGRMLELGCGVGSRLCALARAFPECSGVGVELEANLVRYGRERATRLGLANRISYVHGDAQTYQADAPFDLVTWSQFFFPESSRSGALAAARRALRPGGWITAPVIWDEPGPEPGSKEDQDLAAELLLMDLWRVPPRTTTEVAAEFVAAGFVEVRIDRGAMAALVRGRQPQPAHGSPEAAAPD